MAMHQVTSASPERAPFRRQLDFWGFSLVTALAKGLSPLEDASSKWGERFIDTQHVDMGDDLCALLAVVTLAKLGHESHDVANPRRIIDLANRLAAVGCPIVLDKLDSNACAYVSAGSGHRVRERAARRCTRRMTVTYILTDYLEQALAVAVYDKLEDGTFAGRIPLCRGVVALAAR